MNIAVVEQPSELQGLTRRLQGRMLSPFCGLTQEIGFISRGHLEPRMITCGADLTGVHILNGTQHPGRGAYHIGGVGNFLDESVIRALGESVERYSQLVAGVDGRHKTTFASYDEMCSLGERIIRTEQLAFFSSQQLGRTNFPFAAFDRKAPLSWVKLHSLLKGRGDMWVPAQLVFVGYGVKRDRAEPWMLSAVTTGTAAHVDLARALRNSVLEIVQIDSAMGHWYSGARAMRITIDSRLRLFDKLLSEACVGGGPIPEFYWLPNADLSGMTVACIIRSGNGVNIGLGAGTRLAETMYKAFLESVGVLSLARFVRLGLKNDELPDPGDMLDLENNVAFYALGHNAQRINSKFGSETVAASDLPPDMEVDVSSELRDVIKGFERTGKDLFFADLTTVEAKELGFVVTRLWSPDTISLSLPSAPPALHSRLIAYGGIAHEDPHPYP
jgi:thiazole/oxazole-forming peptide maturase SagD family component